MKRPKERDAVVVLDTTTLVDADRNGLPVQRMVEEHLAQGDDIVVPIQVAIEYCAGRHDPAAGLTALRESFWIVPCDEEIGLEAARLAREAFSGGRFPGWADVQIAATARYLGMPILTRNRLHFDGLGVEVLEYTV